MFDAGASMSKGIQIAAALRRAALRTGGGLAVLWAMASAMFGVELPAGVEAVWDMGLAHREATLSRERICLNGLWRWQPSGGKEEAVPTNRWGWFKVPGAWPGITDYMQKDCQTVFAHEDWKSEPLGNVSAAWHEREFSAPEGWAGRRIVLSTEYLNSFAEVWVDGQRAGEMRFPAGEVDLTAFCRPGATQRLSLLVQAMPLKGVMLSYTDSASAREVKGAVARRGLCGDVWLESIRSGPRIGRARVSTSVRNGEIVFDTELAGLKEDGAYRLRAEIAGTERTKLESAPFSGRDLESGRMRFAEKWRPEKLWDLHTPTNQLRAVLALVDAEEKELDFSAPVRFGFRELWIDGRDFYLNGTRLFLSAVPLDNAQVGAHWATYDGARESLERLKSFGINFVYTHNYDCEPGAHLSFGEILRAADDAGLLVALSQPHFSHYDWKGSGAESTNGYAEHARFYANVAGNHPSVVFYAMSHNATGYSEDMNPNMIDGVQHGRDTWALNNARLASRAEAIVAGIDPSRIVYHHASGNLGTMHPINFYPNFVPPQEMSDWFGHWAANGVKPAFLCEYGAPFTWDWTMYRGWFKGQREFGSAKVPWEFCIAEWNAQFFGDRAYQTSEAEKTNLRWEAKQFREGKLWHRWDYPHPVGSSVFEERYPVFALYLKENWRAFRAWGVSAISPWEYEHFWKLRPGARKERQELAVDWRNLQRPGYSADYLGQRYERMDLAFERDDWIPTVAAQALMANNGPLLGFIAGKEEAFTSKDHNFRAGDALEKQLVVINNSRETVACKVSWSLPWASGERELELPTGQQERIAVHMQLPRGLAPGEVKLSARFDFGAGRVQTDELALHVLAEAPPPKARGRTALYDPAGETKAWLEENRITFQEVQAGSDLGAFDLLVIGKAALDVAGPGPDLSRVREGLKVVVFEQTGEVLEKRLGFRVAEYGLRQVFARVANHPLLEGIGAEHLRDWRGEATLLPAQLKYELRPRHGPTVNWCGIPVPRLWRCGNRGNVASVLIEKPPGGDFLPIADGGYALQYSPLLEHREGKGMVLFCQMDVTARTERDPASERLLRNILEYASNWKPGPRRAVAYAGGAAGRRFLESIGANPGDSSNLAANTVLVVDAAGAEALSGRKKEIGRWLRGGGKLLAAGLNEREANAILESAIATREAEHISAHFTAAEPGSPFAGIAPADLHNRDPHAIPLVTRAASAIGGGVLAASEMNAVVFGQVAPWRYAERDKMNVKRTFRRSSFAFSRLLGNLGAERRTPLLAHFKSAPGQSDRRWLSGLYLDEPEEWDDPYRFFRW